MDVRRFVKTALCMAIGMAAAPVLYAQDPGGLGSASVNVGGATPPPALPNCPMANLGQMNGIFIYLTSDCANTTGYGSSPEEIPVPQCQPGGTCGRPIVRLGLPASQYMVALYQPPGATAAEIAKWVQELQGQKAAVEKGINGRTKGDSRRDQLESQLSLINQTLAKLNSTDPASAKRQAYDQNKATMDAYAKSFRQVGLVSPNTQRIGLLDAKSKQVLKTAADTNYSTANVNAAQFRVNAKKSKVVKVTTAANQFAYFQCFDVLVEVPGNPSITTLKLGVQVKPDGISNAENAEFSERGNFAHRVLDGSGNPYLVNSIDSLEPK